MSQHSMSDERYYERKRQITDLHSYVPLDGLPPITRTVLVEFVRDGGWTWTLAYVDLLGKWVEQPSGIGIDEPVQLWWPLPLMPIREQEVQP